MPYALISQFFAVVPVSWYAIISWGGSVPLFKIRVDLIEIIFGEDLISGVGLTIDSASDAWGIKAREMEPCQSSTAVALSIYP